MPANQAMPDNPPYFGKNHVQLTWPTIQNTVICNGNVVTYRIKIRARVHAVFRKTRDAPRTLNSCLNQKISPDCENGYRHPKRGGMGLAASCCPKGIAARRVTRGIRCSVQRQIVWIRRFSGIGPVPDKYKCQVDLQLRLRHAPLAFSGRLGRG